MGEDLSAALDEVQRVADSREEYERGTLLWNMAADRASDSAWRLAAVVRAVLDLCDEQIEASERHAPDHRPCELLSRVQQAKRIRAAITKAWEEQR